MQSILNVMLLCWWFTKEILKSSPFYGKKPWNKVGAREADVWNAGAYSDKELKRAIARNAAFSISLPDQHKITVF